MRNMKTLMAGFMGMAPTLEPIRTAEPDSNPKVTTKERPVYRGVIMPPKKWQKRKKRLSMQNTSRKANRK